MRTKAMRFYSLHCGFCFIIALLMLSLLVHTSASAQQNNHYTRIANIIVDSADLENYKMALKEGMQAAVSKEPGVLSLYAVYDKEHPTHVTVFETYADVEAYKLHTQTPHFKKYKSTVEKMVKSLQLTDVIPIALEAKKQM